MTSSHKPNVFDICDGSENIPIHYLDETMKYKNTEFQYVCCNIPGHGTNAELFEDTIDGCDCTDEKCDLSRDSKCSCVQRVWSSRGDDAVSGECLAFPRISAIECNSTCQCSSKCGNRIVQHGIQHKLEVYEDPLKGFCIRTLEPIERNTFVCEYAGEVLTAFEAERRFAMQKKTNMNYIFALKEHFASGLQITIVDPRHFGNIGRFLNHSCEPNLFMTPVRVNSFVPKLCLFAKRYIYAGEELTYNYGGNELSHISDNPDVAESLVPCHCKSKTCVGYLPFNVSALNE